MVLKFKAVDLVILYIYHMPVAARDFVVKPFRFFKKFIIGNMSMFSSETDKVIFFLSMCLCYALDTLHFVFMAIVSGKMSRMVMMIGSLRSSRS